MLDRRRKNKGYGVVPQDAAGEDLELGSRDRQESGIVEAEEDWDDLHRASSTDNDGRTPPESTSASAGEEGGDGKK